MTEKLKKRPLCVDLDGSLIKSDSLEEAACAALRRNLFDLFRFPLWLQRGLPLLKREIYLRSDTDPSRLPYNTELLDALQLEKANGRRLVLATGARLEFARKVNDHLGLFDDVHATTDDVNLTGKNKANRLAEHYPEFDYVGNGRIDLEVWKKAKGAWVVGSSKLAREAEKLCPVERRFDPPRITFKVLRKALRVHQWAKNALIFLPMFLSHNYDGGWYWMRCIIAFFSFSCISSAVYLFNDLLDIESDRRHPDNRRRAFAAGDLSILKGLLLTPLLIGSGLALGFFLSWEYFFVVIGYFVLTSLYSVRLKRIVMADIIVLALLYTSRVFAGGIATETMLTEWLLTFLLFFFLSLATMKRCSELILTEQTKEKENKRRGYLVGDLPLLISVGMSSAFLSVLVLALYLNDHRVSGDLRYPEAMWVLCPLLLYWICRIWFKTYRGQMHTDPLVFALRDKASYLVAMITGLLWILARGSSFIPFKF